ncbi:MAG: carbohydrate binding domain-containing protein, partial [Cellvibrio sp.]
MKMFKRIVSNSQLLLTCAISALVSVSTQAGVIVPKPAPHESQNPEMARVLARVGTYTIAGAEQETRTVPGDVIVAEPSQFQGAVYLFNGTNATPERVYQFPGLTHTMEYAGWSVAMSNQWVAFTTSPYNKSTTQPAQYDTNETYIYIAGKTNGAWASCPTLNSVANNCNESFRDNGSNISKPLTRIGFGYRTDPGGRRLSLDNFELAISDKYLVVTDSSKSIVKFYRYDAASNNWILEHNVDDDDYKTFGKSVAIYGDKIAVSSTWEGNTAVSNGTVRIFHRNATTGTWSMTSQVDGHYLNGTFGRKIKMDGNNLVVTNGSNLLAFFRFDSNDRLTGSPYMLTTPNEVTNLSLYGDMLAVSGYSPELPLTIYSRNTANSALEWKRITGLKSDFYANINIGSTGGYFGADEIGLVGDDISLGWRVFNPTTPSFFHGGVIHEKISLLDPCRSPKNLVTNCSFDNVTNTSLNGSASGNNWTLLNHNGGSGGVSYNDRQMRVNVYSPGYDMWHIQARTPVNLSQAVKYKLSFRAKADSNRSFVVNIGHNGNQDNNWQSYGRETVYATTNWTEYSYEFQMPMDSNAFLDFNFGNAGTSAVTIDGVSLTSI